MSLQRKLPVLSVLLYLDGLMYFSAIYFFIPSKEFFITEFCFYNQTCFIVVRLSFSQFLTLLFQLVILSVIILFVNKRELIYTEIYKICQTLPLNQQDFCFCDSYCCYLNLCLSHNLVITHRILLLLLSFIFL